MKKINEPEAKKPQTKLKEPKKVAVVKSSKAKTSVLGHGVGRRKRSVARAWLKRGKGSIRVNGKDAKDYFDIEYNRSEVYIPFKLLSVNNYDVNVNVYGGGVNSQASAIKLGISRALVDHDFSVKIDLRKLRLLTVDSRVKERKKYGQKGARRKFQFVKR